MGLAEVYSDLDKFSEAVLEIRSTDIENPLVCKLGGGIVRFVNATFPGQEHSGLYANTFERDESIGPHFDVYGDYLDREFPWVGVYNLAGSASVRATPLPDELTRIYREMYPKRTEEAGEARRQFGAIALGNPGIEPTTFNLSPGVGMVLPQRPGGVEIIHDVQPHSSESISKPGRYIKIVKPNKSEETRKVLTEEFNYKPLDVLTTEALGGDTVTEPEPIELRINMDKPAHEQQELRSYPARRRRAPRRLD